MFALSVAIFATEKPVKLTRCLGLSEA